MSTDQQYSVGDLMPVVAGGWQRVFLEALREEPNVSRACSVARISRTAAYNFRNEDACFRDAWAEAIAQGVDELEAEARRRALAGSDRLLIFLLKSYRRDVFSESAYVDIFFTNLRHHALRMASELGLSEHEALEVLDEVQREAP